LSHPVARPRLADLLDAPVDRPMIQESTAPGATYLAGRSGFRPFRRRVEIANDPRLDRTAPRDAARHVPIIE
jgi:glycerol kinase